MVGGRVLLLAIAVAEAAWLPALVAQGQLFSNARFPSNRYGQGAQKQHPPKAASLLNRMRARPHPHRTVSMHAEHSESSMSSPGMQIGHAKAGVQLEVKAGKAPSLSRDSPLAAPLKKSASHRGRGGSIKSYAGLNKADHTAKLKAEKATELMVAKTAAAAKAKAAEEMAASAEAKAEKAVLTAEARALAMFKSKSQAETKSQTETGSAKATGPPPTPAEAVKAALVSLGTPAVVAASGAPLPPAAEDAAASPVALDSEATAEKTLSEQEAEIAAAEKAVDDAAAAAAFARAEQEVELEQVARDRKSVV